MTRRRLLSLLAAVALAIVGAAILYAYVRGADERAVAGRERVEVLVTTGQIDAGVPATVLADATDLATVRMATDVAERINALSAATLQSLGEQVTIAKIPEGSPLTSTQFGDAETASRTEDGAAVDEGREELSIVLPEEQALGGRVQADDRVGVIITVDAADPGDTAESSDGGDSGEPRTGLALTNVRVTRVAGAGGQATTDEEDSAPTGEPMTVWLDVSPEDAERIVFGQLNGTIWLTRHGEGDVRSPDDQLRDSGNIFDGIDAPQPSSRSTGDDGGDS